MTHSFENERSRDLYLKLFFNRKRRQKLTEPVVMGKTCENQTRDGKIEAKGTKSNISLNYLRCGV